MENAILETEQIVAGFERRDLSIRTGKAEITSPINLCNQSEKAVTAFRAVWYGQGSDPVTPKGEPRDPNHWFEEYDMKPKVVGKK